MNTSTVKGDRKREIGQSPIKKKIKDSTISREDLDDAIANGVKLALKEQQSTLKSVAYFGSKRCGGLGADSSIA